MRELWTDGSALPNPGPGGYAVIEEGEPIALGSEKDTTNIRMEGEAIITALKMLNGQKALIYTDSEFWVNVLTRWAAFWEKRDWKKKVGEIQNLDIVREMWTLYTDGRAKVIWTKGHNGTTYNEAADEWANKARKGATL